MRLMPVEFLTDEQVAAYGRYTGPHARAQRERFCREVQKDGVMDRDVDEDEMEAAAFVAEALGMMDKVAVVHLT
ncbi:MAG: hypothetical protein QOE72_3264 [Chloroflexota bacterium]|jgi:hypothetical protein|nr:hypothetical protein [Chloroflexota bacterium]